MSNLAAALIFGLIAGSAVAQNPPPHNRLPWQLADYPTGGRVFSNIVAEPLISKPDLLQPTCRALAPGNAQQAASGIAGIGIAIATAPLDVSEDLFSRLPECCPYLVSAGDDANVRIGAALALATRELGEDDIYSAREVDDLIHICGDETLLRSYEIALGNMTGVAVTLPRTARMAPMSPVQSIRQRPAAACRRQTEV